MSKLGSLFSNSATDSNDSLKYSAPKEPKLNLQPATNPKKNSVSFAPSVDHSKPTTAIATKPLGPSKILANASILLYKVNPSTNGYDTVENGAPLGCVLMGTGTSFQIFIYNGQQVPQASIMIHRNFNYTIRDFYMSCSDQTGASWSILFSTADAMNNFVRHIAVTIIHCASHTEAPTPLPGSTTESTGIIKRLLPSPVLSSSDQDDTVLTISSTAATAMAAGIYLKVWEISEQMADYPSEVLTSTPLKQTQPPEDVVKVKMISSEEIIAGITKCLDGSKKGEKFIAGISPAVFYKTNGSYLDVNSRVNTTSWIVVEVEIAKIKSDKKKVEKKVEELQPDINNESSNLKERMGRLSGGAANQLGDIMSSNKMSSSVTPTVEPVKARDVVSQPSYNESRSQLDDRHDRYRDEGPSYSRQSSDRRESINSMRLNPDEFERRNSAMERNYSANDSYTQSSSGYENALTVVDGQRPRSYYLDQQPSQRNNGVPRDYEQSNYNGGYDRNHAPLPASDSFMSSSSLLPSSQLNQLQQSVMVVQQNVIQLHTKLDQVGMNVQQSMQIQQQHQFQNMNMMPSMINTMPGGYNPSLIPGYPMAMNHPNAKMMTMHPQQIGLLQSQPTTNNPIRLKSEELISNLQFIVQEYDRLKQENTANGAQSGSSGNSKAMAELEDKIQSLRSTISKLEDRNETLQNRNEKLMNEKSALLEKQSELMQAGSSANNKTYSMQQEIDDLRREKSELKANLATYQNQGSNSREMVSDLESQVKDLKDQVRELNLDKKSLEQTWKMKLDETNARLQDEYDEKISSSGKIDWNSPEILKFVETKVNEVEGIWEEKLSSLKGSHERELSKLRVTIEELESTISGLESKSEMEQDLSHELSELKMEMKRVSASRSNLEDQLVEVTERLQQEVATNVELKMRIQMLQTELDQSKGNTSLSEELLRGLMQDVYEKAQEVFAGEDQAEEKIFNPSSVLKGLKGVLKKVTTARLAVK